MKRSLFALSGLAVLTAGTLWYLSAESPDYAAEPPASATGAQQPDTGTASQATAPETPPLPREGAEATLTDEQWQMLEDPRVIEFTERLAFESELRTFFDSAPELGQQQLREQSRNIEQELGRYEERGEVSAPEALMVRLALAKVVETDPERRQQAIQTLTEHYTEQSEARLSAWKAEPKPEFESYKQREKAIVAEVMAMDTIPGNMSRSDYLRQRLQEARVETMGGGGED